MCYTENSGCGKTIISSKAKENKDVRCSEVYQAVLHFRILIQENCLLQLN